jgi:hypothetical protein
MPDTGFHLPLSNITNTFHTAWAKTDISVQIQKTVHVHLRTATINYV